VKDILRRDGLRGLYRGLGPTVLGYLPTWAIYFTIYDSAKAYLSEDDPADAEPAPDTKGKGRIYPAPHAKGYIHHQVHDHVWAVHIVAAMTAGAASTIATNPLWVIKTRFMVRTIAQEVLFALSAGICADASRRRASL
jgi:solute carrier family 25 folate transporter 32